MTTLDRDAWLKDFKARHGLDDALGADPDLVAERAEKAAAYAATTTPQRYADALPTAPAVDGWVAAVLRQAIRESWQRNQMVTTIHGGPSLLLVGITGTGKTHQAYGAMRAISLFGVHAQWVVISAADLYARLRPRHGVDSEEAFRAVAEAPVLVVDDLGAAKTSEWVEEVNFRLVNHRYETAKPTLFTSNVPPTRHTAILGERVVSRLAEMTTRVSLKGQDRRMPR